MEPTSIFKMYDPSEQKGTDFPLQPTPKGKVDFGGYVKTNEFRQSDTFMVSVIQLSAAPASQPLFNGWMPSLYEGPEKQGR